MAIGEMANLPKNCESLTLKRRLRALLIGLEVYDIRSFVVVHMKIKIYRSWSKGFGVTASEILNVLTLKMKVKNI